MTSIYRKSSFSFLVTKDRIQSLSAYLRSFKKVLQNKAHIISGLVVGLSACLLALPQAEAATFSFTKIADTNTPIPGGVGNFNSFDAPSLDKGNMAFVGGRFNDSQNYQTGVYTNIGGSLQLVADSNTSVSGGTGQFTNFSNLVLDNQTVAFESGDYAIDRSIYSNPGGSLKPVVNLNTPIPSGQGNFSSFLGFSLDQDSVAFVGENYSDTPQQSGVYINNAGSLQVIADKNTPIPRGKGNFTNFYNPSVDNGSVAFVGVGYSTIPFQSGIYINNAGSLQVIADENTPVPGSQGNFTSFQQPNLNQGNVVFIGQGVGNGQTSLKGVYTNIRDSLQVVADTNTDVPLGRGKFFYFNNPLLDNGNITFQGSFDERQVCFYRGCIFVPSKSGLYTTLGGSVTKIIDSNDLLDGKKVNFLSVNTKAFSGNQIAFTANFVNGDRGIYVATLNSKPIPESSNIFGVLGIGVLGTGSVLQRKYRK